MCGDHEWGDDTGDSHWAEQTPRQKSNSVIKSGPDSHGKSSYEPPRSLFGVFSKTKSDAITMSACSALIAYLDYSH